MLVECKDRKRDWNVPSTWPVRPGAVAWCSRPWLASVLPWPYPPAMQTPPSLFPQVSLDPLPLGAPSLSSHLSYSQVILGRGLGRVLPSGRDTFSAPASSGGRLPFRDRQLITCASKSSSWYKDSSQKRNLVGHLSIR